VVDLLSSTPAVPSHRPTSSRPGIGRLDPFSSRDVFQSRARPLIYVASDDGIIYAVAVPLP
jgi:hypothetical protein